MIFLIDPSNGLAIYDQVVRQMKFAVADGVLREGELAPSARELARTLAINPNTVTRAYNELQADGVLESIRGTGLAVKKKATERCRKERLALVRQRVRDTVLDAKHSRLAMDEIRKIVDEELNRAETQETSK